MPYIKQLKLSYGRKRVKDDLLAKSVTTPQQVFELFREMQNETREKLVCLHLNTKLKILSYEIVSIGTAHETISDPVEIFRGAIVVRAYSVILIHNHPSGDPLPSEDDLTAASKIAKLGELHKIPLQDFIIIGDDKYYSFKQEKLLKKKDRSTAKPKKMPEK